MQPTRTAVRQQPQDPVAARLGLFACYGAAALALGISLLNLLR